MKSSEIFAIRIRELRNEKELKIRELADKLDITHSSISMYENRKRVPTIDTLQLFVEYFNVSADYLLGFSEKRERK